VAVLDADAAWLKSHEDQLVMIEGHCDERGTNEYNVALGERRAKATMNYLVSRGVAANRITVTSYGEERPSCTEKTEGCWAKNRRAHFLIKGK
jgi:peptidoglycan-associated lipoprotein